MSRAAAVRFGFLVCIAVLPWALLGDEPPTSKQPGANRPAKEAASQPAAVSPEESIRRALKSSADVDWVELPLEECLQFLATAKKLPIWIDRTTIADEGVQLDTPVTLRLPGATLQSVLNLLLGPNQLTEVIRNEVLVITTAVAAGENLETRIHPVSKANEGKESSALIDVLVSTIEPETWDAVGGPGSIREMRGALIVRQNQAVHQQIEALLQNLERVITSTQKPEIPRIGERAISPDEQKIYRALDTPTEVDWVELPLEECIQFLQTTKNINIWIDRTTIADEGVQMDTPVTLRVAGIRFSSLLKLLLEPNQLAWVIEDDVMKITTRVHAGERLVTAIYDVRDLFELMPAPAAPKFQNPGGGFFDVVSSVSSRQHLTQGFGGGGIGCGTSIPGLQTYRLDDHDPVSDLEDLISSTVEYETWEAVGGPGVMREHRGTLVVRQTQAVHLEIEKLFAEMRRVAAADQANRPAKKPADPNALTLRVYQMPHYPSEDLAKSIPDLVATETWDSAGGKGIVRAVKGALLVWQTRAVHRQVIDLLNELPIWSYTPQPAPAPKTDPPAKTDPAAKLNETAKQVRPGGGFFSVRSAEESSTTRND